jgi:outer membrane lipoprotein-sorting protein
MRTIFLIWIVLNFAFTAKAQQDTKARQILEEVSVKTRSLESIKVNFIFTMENEKMDIHEKNEGTLQLKGQKYVVELPDVGVKVYSDGETLWNYMEDGNQVTISNLEEGGSELMNPSTIFTIYEKGFQSKYAGERKEGNIIYHQIELYPDTEEYEVNKILISVDKADKMIKVAQLFGTDGNLYCVKVEKMDTDMKLPDSFFVFNPKEYSDLEVIDFR